MADIDINDVIKFRRAYIASRTTMNDCNDDDMTIEPSDSISVMKTPPPIPMPPPMPMMHTGKGTKRNKGDHSVFDLRPKDMKVGPDVLHRPSPRSFGFDDSAKFSRPFSQNELQSAKVKLRKVNATNDKSDRSDHGSNNELKVKILNKSRSQFQESTYKTKESDTIKRKSNGTLSTESKSKGKTKHEVKSIINDFTKLLFEPTDVNSQSRKANIDRLRARFNHNRALPADEEDQTWFKRIEKWLRDVEDVNEDTLTDKQRDTLVTVIVESDDNDHTDNHSKTSHETQLRKSKRRPSNSTSRSIRTPSVCFSHPEGNDSLSEVSADDIVNIKRKQPNFGSYDYICDQLEIREPFNNSELNVLHAMCCEYKTLTELTYAKRIFQIRSMQHSNRIYNFLASHRRSGWLEKGDITKGVNNCRTLDFIFTTILRRRSKRISGYTLNLDGFKKGKTLDIERFSRIMISAFNRREYLFKCAVGELVSYSSIK